MKLVKQFSESVMELLNIAPLDHVNESRSDWDVSMLIADDADAKDRILRLAGIGHWP